MPTVATLGKVKPLLAKGWAPDTLAIGSKAAYLWCANGIIEPRLVHAFGRAALDAATTRNWPRFSIASYCRRESKYGLTFHISDNTKEKEMGFNNAGLGPSDQQIIQRLQPVIIDTLRKAAVKIQQGGGRAESRQWFGDAGDVWMKDLGRKLQTLASMINTKPIDVSFSKLNKRCSGEFAAAPMPAGGWRDFAGGQNPMTVGQNRNFRIWLNLDWNMTPLFRPFKRPADSKFQTLVHECTHLFLNTDDDAYGVATCEVTAAKNPVIAKKTADCWGYFVEEFHSGS